MPRYTWRLFLSLLMLAGFGLAGFSARSLDRNGSTMNTAPTDWPSPPGRDPSIRSLLAYPALGLTLVALSILLTGAGTALSSYRRGRRRAAAAATRRRQAMQRRFNPYISGEPVRDRAMFFGRSELVGRILSVLHQNSIMLQGEPRIGKTTLLYRLCDELQALADPDWCFIPVLVDLEGTSQAGFFRLLMENAANAARAYLPEMPNLRCTAAAAPEQAYADRDFSVDLRSLVDALTVVQQPRSVRLVLLIDEMDAINSYGSVLQQQFRRVFMSTQGPSLGAVVAGTHIDKTWDRVESPWYNLFNDIRLEPFTDEDARRLLIDPVRGAYEWEPAALEFVVAHAAGRPYRLQQYGLESVNHMLGEGRQHITVADVTAADQAVAQTRAAEERLSKLT